MNVLIDRIEEINLEEIASEKCTGQVVLLPREIPKAKRKRITVTVA